MPQRWLLPDSREQLLTTLLPRRAVLRDARAQERAGRAGLAARRRAELEASKPL